MSLLARIGSARAKRAAPVQQVAPTVSSSTDTEATPAVATATVAATPHRKAAASTTASNVATKAKPKAHQPAPAPEPEADEVADDDGGDEIAGDDLASGFTSRVQYQAKKAAPAQVAKKAPKKAPVAKKAPVVATPANEDSAPPTPTGDDNQTDEPDVVEAAPKKPKKRKRDADAPAAAAAKPAAKRSRGKVDPLDEKVNAYVTQQEKLASADEAYDKTLLMSGRSAGQHGVPTQLFSWCPARIARQELVLQGEIDENEKGMKSLATDARKILEPLKEYGATGKVQTRASVLKGAIAKSRIEISNCISRCSAAGDSVLMFSFLESGVAQTTGTYFVTHNLANCKADDVNRMLNLIREHGQAALATKWRNAYHTFENGLEGSGAISNMSLGTFVDSIRDDLNSREDGMSQLDAMAAVASLARFGLTPDVFAEPEEIRAVAPPAAKKRKPNPK